MFIRTFTPIADKDRILQKLEEVAAELESDMINGGWTGKTVTLKYKLDTYQGLSRLCLLLVGLVWTCFFTSSASFHPCQVL